MKKRTFNIIIWAALLAFLVLSISLPIVLVRLSLGISVKAQETLGRYRITLELIGTYLNQNSGKWPKSWDDLAKVQHNDFGGIRWPADIDQIKQRIHVNFDTNTEAVIAGGIENFSAVTQSTPNYGPFPWFIHTLLYEARRSVGRIPAEKKVNGHAGE
jgi:hypothetical protein